MKAVKFLFIAMFVISPSLFFGQKSFDVTLGVTTLSIGDRTGYTITITGMSEKEAEKALRNLLGERQKKPTIAETGKHEIMVDDILLTEFSDTPIDIYFLFEEDKGEVKVTGCFSVNGEFVSSTVNADKVTTANLFMQKFGLRTEKLKVTAMLEEAQKELEKKQSEQESLERKNEVLNKTIDDCTKTIEKAKSDLEQNAKDQEAKKVEISSQQNAVGKVQDELKKYEGN